MRRGLALLLIALAAALVPAAAEAQCAMCRTALESPEGLALAAGFRRGVLFLLAVPFSALAVIAGLIIHRTRKDVDQESPR